MYENDLNNHVDTPLRFSAKIVLSLNFDHRFWESKNETAHGINLYNGAETLNFVLGTNELPKMHSHVINCAILDSCQKSYDLNLPNIIDRKL